MPLYNRNGEEMPLERAFTNVEYDDVIIVKYPSNECIYCARHALGDPQISEPIRYKGELIHIIIDESGAGIGMPPCSQGGSQC